MERETFISSLKEKAGVDNVSERSYGEVADMYLPKFADDSKITDELWEDPIKTIKIISGQTRHDTSVGINEFKAKYEADSKAAQEKAKADAIAAAKAEWEKEKAKAEPSQKTTDESQDVSKLIDEKVNAALAGLTGEKGAIGEIKSLLTGYIAKSEQEKKDAFVAKVKSELKGYLLDERGADREPVVNLAIKELGFDEKADFDKLKVDVEKKYEKLYKDFYGDSHGGPWAGGGGEGGDSTTDFKKFIEGRQSKAAQEAKDAEALKTLLK